tara:strand:- start:483 stop:641 length:159 start_codon:yes stop_codon:yes gene_type:complete
MNSDIDIKDKWNESIPNGEDGDYTLEWTKNGAKKKRVIQEVMHDDLNSEDLA